MVPFDTETPFVTSGIRIGTAAVTTRGLKEDDCRKVVDWIDNIITDADNEELITHTRTQINTFMQDFPLYSESEINI